MKSEDFIRLRLLLGTYVTAPLAAPYIVKISPIIHIHKKDAPNEFEVSLIINESLSYYSLSLNVLLNNLILSGQKPHHSS